MKIQNIAISLSCAVVSYLIFVGLQYGIERFATAIENPWLAPLVLLAGLAAVLAGLATFVMAIVAWFIK